MLDGLRRGRAGQSVREAFFLQRFPLYTLCPPRQRLRAAVPANPAAGLPVVGRQVGFSNAHGPEVGHGEVHDVVQPLQVSPLAAKGVGNVPAPG